VNEEVDDCVRDLYVVISTARQWRGRLTVDVLRACMVLLFPRTMRAKKCSNVVCCTRFGSCDLTGIHASSFSWRRRRRGALEGSK
jgi:hypothetical protein